ncbi:hypothetical protein KL918_005111 [Ogataea parapolymorpha]|uniref:Uncharacterized protein n=1 Tax=Ogataea parapolymorpha (strain ATCC 26012 / BCRC 20466 / JCM 22074 / NRRL Y-7560 / DL-1) TaxID=871575 RepID=W1QIC4_OGAPD|nr:hypothetical protein HPODL_04824 [Ogataea parapolymorpha DL-1]ESX02064.1 hypothetical protein HPODL_04824 [Ogataea parapolymorpha DL-1]KAG7864985.1 hypothetical protein KL918_005111 [Ogataea parapolymorpha]KAG7871512.1 hypothetical protein KL916_003863 [Ogataea parapolymorpha]
MLLISPQLCNYANYPVFSVQRRVTPAIHRLEDDNNYYVVFEQTCQRPFFEDYEFEIRGRKLLVSCDKDDFYKVLDMPDDADLRRDIDLRWVNGALLVAIPKRRPIRISFNAFDDSFTTSPVSVRKGKHSRSTKKHTEILSEPEQPEHVKRIPIETPQEEKKQTVSELSRPSRPVARVPREIIHPEADLKKNYTTMERHTSLAPKTYSPTIEDVADEEFA